MNIHEKFESVNEDYLEFDRVVNKKNSRPDIHAFILLSELFPNKTRDIVCGDSHDEIYLDVDEDEMESLTMQSIIELVRCGVRHDEEGLCMFV